MEVSGLWDQIPALFRRGRVFHRGIVNASKPSRARQVLAHMFNQPPSYCYEFDLQAYLKLEDTALLMAVINVQTVRICMRLEIHIEKTRPRGRIF